MRLTGHVAHVGGSEMHEVF